jgi:Ca2+-binding RTX toxin-like protein
MAIVTGTSGANNLKGTALADQIFGLGGNDTLTGLDGNDVLEGGTGADELFGTAGFDTASYRNSSEGVSVNLLNFEFYYGEAEGDHLYNIDGVRGSAFQDSLTGDDVRNILQGEGGRDVLRGNGGNDRLEGGGGSDFLEGGQGNDELRGGDGTDTASFIDPDAGAPVTADLVAGTAAGTGTWGYLIGSDRLFGIENLRGTRYADQLAGNDGANRLEGAYGADALVGRGGADRFVYNFHYDSAPATGPDRILDFSPAQGDKVDLSILDANGQVPGEQAFAFIGQGQFTGAGQLRFFQENGDTVVEANMTDAFAGAEMRIVLDPLVSLQDTDFLL